MPFNSNGCLLPTPSEWMELQRELFPRFMAGRLGFELLPFKTTDKPSIILRQPDVLKGLQAFRGLGKPTLQVPNPPNPYGTYCYIEPGYWGEHDQLGEEALTKYGSPTNCNDPMDMMEHLSLKQENLLERRANRIEYNIWQVLTFGRYTALNQAGQVIFEAQFNIQNVSAAIPWTNFLQSTPLRDFRAIQLLGRGTSARFDTCARAIMNRETANLLFSNQNTNDVGKIGLSACCTFMSPNMINEQFAAQGLPQIEIYDEGYYDDNNQFNIYIPYGYVIIVGCRPNNVPVGNYWLTRNAAGCQISSGFWQEIIDTCGRELPPRKIFVADGHNGGAALEYPRMLAVLRVA